MFCEGDSTAWNSASSPHLCQNGGLPVLSSIGGNRKIGWVGDNSHVVCSQKFPGWKGSVRWCIVVMQQPVVLSPKFRSKSSHIFMHSPWNVTVVFGIDSLACQDELFTINPLDVKENDGHTIDFALHLSRLFSVSVSLVFPCAAHTFFPERLSNHSVSIPPFLRFAQIWCCSFVRSIAKSHQVRYVTPNNSTYKSAHPPNCVKFFTPTPKIC
jgi:hypothetical protein